MNETKLGPNGEIIGVDGPEDDRSRMQQWWMATAGIRLIVLAGVLAIVGVVLMARIA